MHSSVVPILVQAIVEVPILLDIGKYRYRLFYRHRYMCVAGPVK